jgi:hypothetical protein
MSAMKRRILASSLLALCTSTTAFASTLVLLPAQSTDLVPIALLANSATTTAQASLASARKPPLPTERRPVSISWALPHDQAIQSVTQPFTRSSREYWIDVSATELQRGIQLPLSAPGAIIRLSPSDPVGGKLQSTNVRLQLGRQSMNLAQAASQLADAPSLQAAGMDVPAASMVMKLKPELGSGLATLQAPDASGRYVVHVFEPESSLTVTAPADRNDLLLGNHVHVRVSMHDADRDAPLAAVGGFLRAPDGSTTLLDYQQQSDGSFTVDAQPRNIPSALGLWEVHTFTSGIDANGDEVRRDTTTVFSAATPTARLSGMAKTSAARDHGIDISVGVTAQSASRFAVSAVLYGRDAHGEMVPAAFAQTAAVLRKGDGQLVLRYDPASLQGVGAPYELHDLRLQDQPALGLIERRALAMRFDTP